MDHVVFRSGEIGGYVFTRYPDGESPSVTAEHLARVYSQSIADPTPKCTLVSITAVEGADWPTYDFVAEGFYPGEGRLIMLKGDVEIAGKTESFVSGDVGLTVESADSEGRIEENITFAYIEIAGEDVILPDEFTLSVWGQLSECEVTEIVPWTGE